MDSGDFGRRLRILMACRCIGVSELASKAGISRQSVHAYLSDGSIPSLSTAVSIAKALDISVDDLSETPLSDIVD
ncbi:MAG: helix-turn-helix transcriptional regulator [Coriobacteriaceae bacterium]|nr:helix-turn-helix transcriptional regulator [Coriobacteriaceae bacterium]